MDAKPAIPEHPEAITAVWLQQALAVGGNRDFPAIRDVSLTDIGAGIGMVGSIFRCNLTYRDQNAAGPQSLVIKMPSAHRETLETARRLRLYQREFAFYTTLASQLPLRSPALRYGDFDERSHRFVLLLEDLGYMILADQVDGASAAQARTAIRAAARLHARYWNRVGQPPVSAFHTSSASERHALTQAVYQASLEPALNRFGHLFTDAMRRLAEAYGARLAAHLEAVDRASQTFTHGDYRLDNMFFGAADEDFAVVDWQVCGIINGLSDVAYFLSSSVPTPVRREIESEVIAEYHDIIRASGVDDFSLADCWRNYRLNLLGCFRTPIIAGGQLDFTGDRSRQLADAFLQRTLTAIDDLDAAEFLPAPPN